MPEFLILQTPPGMEISPKKMGWTEFPKDGFFQSLNLRNPEKIHLILSAKLLYQSSINFSIPD